MVRKPERSYLLLQLALVVVLLMLLALSLPTLELRDGGPFNLLTYFLRQISFGAPSVPPAVEPLQGDWIGGLRLLFWVLAPIAILYAIISPQYRRLLLRTTIFIIAFVVITNRLREMMRPVGREGEELFGQAGRPETLVGPPPAPDFVTDTPEWFVLVIDLVLVLLLVGIGWFLWRRLRRRPETEAEPEFLASASSALRHLEAGDDVRDVIMRCYAEMTNLLAASGRAQRHRAMTPRDFEAHLARLGMRDEHIHRLTRLFERVRYGGIHPDAATQAEAQACLRAIVSAYGPGHQDVAHKTVVAPGATA